MPVIIPAVLSAAVGAVKLISSAQQAKKDKAEADRLRQAFYPIQNEYLENKNIAEQMATQGLGSATLDFEKQGLQEGVGSLLSGIEQSGGMSVNKAGELISEYTKGIRKVGFDDASARIGNIQNFMETNRQLAAQRTTQWGVNEFGPYQNKLKELTERRAADKLNAWSGATDIVSSASSAITAMQNQKLIDSLFTKGNGSQNDAEFSPVTQQVQSQNLPAIDTSKNLPDLKPLNI